MSNTEVLTPLPQSVAELDVFVAEITKEFGLPDSDDTYESIATLIMHMPPSSASAPKSFFGESVRKSIANLAAWTKLQEFARKRKESSLKQEATQNELASDGPESVQN